MKIGILADIHGNLEALEAVLAHARREGVKKFVCLGDVVGYNANPHECVEIVRNLDCAAIVKGNHDYYASNDELMFNFNPTASLAVKWTRENLTDDDRTWLRFLPLTADVLLTEPPSHFVLVHSTLDKPQDWGYIFNEIHAESSMNFQWTQLCFFGHTHVPVIFEKTLTELQMNDTEHVSIYGSNKYLINVGSVGQPRNHDPRASYGVYNVEEGTINIFKVEYDISKTQKKILKAGLPVLCADRLSFGQ
ncbi:MAG: metallophosphatase family protein [Lentisphaeria bacterium]|nr:metallophosphatase family protein [Lentisphaeria bacterium]